MTLADFHKLETHEREHLSRSPFTRGLPLSAVPENWRETLVQFDLLERVWAHRRCYVCDKLGRCEHREPEFDMAEIAARNDVLVRRAA